MLPLKNLARKGLMVQRDISSSWKGFSRGGFMWNAYEWRKCLLEAIDSLMDLPG